VTSTCYSNASRSFRIFLAWEQYRLTQVLTSDAKSFTKQKR